jgi:hypothetical protein
MTVRFGTDHTVGTNPAKPTPRAMVADNDYAVGQLVEAVSKSAIWNSCAIFIIEDDAQNGPDHVDAHRSTCYVISPWIKKASVDHSFQNTVSVIRTIELLLNLPPMCQYDAIADPIMNWDPSPSNAAPFAAILPSADVLRERNGLLNTTQPISPELRVMAEQSMAMDFSKADQAPADLLNEIIWKSVKGPKSILPPTPRGPSPLAPAQRKRDDDE